ncbi:hypothetical protein H311_00975 [Anncaliia algerae PRA109]|nr:hypothetical protein H311_00975 [Anncaliia algerae PRA109]
MKIVENKSRNILGIEIIANVNPGTKIFTYQCPSYISFFGDQNIYNHTSSTIHLILLIL